MMTQHNTPASDDGLFSDLIRYLIDEGGKEFLVGFFEQVWNRRAQHLEAMIGSPKTTVQRLNRLAELMRMQGFDATVGRGPEGELFLRQGRCPFASASSETALPCQLERQLLEDITGMECERLGLIADGDQACVYRFEEPGD